MGGRDGWLGRQKVTKSDVVDGWVIFGPFPLMLEHVFAAFIESSKKSDFFLKWCQMHKDEGLQYGTRVLKVHILEVGFISL